MSTQQQVPATSTKRGRVILLNGASSAGKSTLARQVQAALSTPFLVLSSDMLASGGCLPPQRNDGAAGSTTEIDVWSWQGVMRPRFFAGWHGCIAAMVAAGNDVIVDHVVEYVNWWVELRRLLGTGDVWVVGVLCDVDVIERREVERSDGRFQGEGRSHLEVLKVHEIVGAGLGRGYDDVVNTTDGVSEEIVEILIQKWNGRKRMTWEERLLEGQMQ